MGYTYDEELLNQYRFWVKWQEWACNKPSLKHPIKYLKWRLSEPKYESVLIISLKGGAL